MNKDLISQKYMLFRVMHYCSYEIRKSVASIFSVFQSAKKFRELWLAIGDMEDIVCVVASVVWR